MRVRDFLKKPRYFIKDGIERIWYEMVGVLRQSQVGMICRNIKIVTIDNFLSDYFTSFIKFKTKKNYPKNYQSKVNVCYISLLQFL